MYSSCFDTNYQQWRNWVDAIVTYLDEQYHLVHTLLYLDSKLILDEIDIAIKDLKLGRRSKARKLLLKLRETIQVLEAKEDLHGKDE